MERGPSKLTELSDAALVSEVMRLAARERAATAHLVEALAEFDARRLYLPAGCSSLFTYCTQVLHLSEHAAYNRIEAARVARRHPEILTGLADGDLTLTTVRLLAPHLADENGDELLKSARHKSKREVEELVAAIRPQADAPASIRKLPSPQTKNAPPVRSEQSSFLGIRPPESGEGGQPPLAMAALQQTEARRAVITPIAPERYKLQFTVSRATHHKLRRAQELLRHVVRDGDPAEVFDRALTLLVEDLEKRKLGAATRARPRPGNGQDGKRPAPSRPSRNIPAELRRTVWARDGGQCAFVGTAGRCTERGWLEFHHVVPYAEGGKATAANLELRCRRHNQYEAERWFGEQSLAIVRHDSAPTARESSARCGASSP